MDYPKDQMIVPRNVEDEVKESYLRYSMSVIISRALPDVRDGLKPSQRRILFAMRQLNLSPGAKHRKCAKICGDTSGDYHPHGESVIYPTLVRMAQEWSMRYQLVDGQTTYGLQFSSFKTSRGTFRTIEHPLFNSNTSWQKLAVAVDLASFNVAYLGDRKTQNKEFNQDGNCADDNGIDAVGGTLTTELTAVVKNPPANAVIYGLTAGAAG